jgi:hypothetical protein
MNTRAAEGPGEFAQDSDGPRFIPRESRFSVEAIAHSIRNFATLSEALRVLGAVVLVASMSVFLLQGWSEGNDISRYLLLLAQTGLLAGAGFAMSHGLRESKGARIFFGLALVSIPANFTILGALLYSVFQWDAGLTTYPGYAHWQIGDAANVGLTLGGAMLVLVPVTMLCFAIMARRSMKPLSLHFLLLNALLLLPIRGSMAAGIIALLGVVYAVLVVGKLTGNDRSLKTGEGKFALASMFIPLGIILFRSMYFYQVDSLMVAMVSMAVFIGLRQVSLLPDRGPKLAILLETLSLPVAFTFSLALTDALAPMVDQVLAGPMFATVYALMSLDVMRRAESRIFRRLVVATTSIIAMLCFSFTVALQPEALTALLALGAGAIMLLAGVSFRGHVASFCGIATLAIGTYFGLEEIWDMVLASSWIDLAIFGAGAIALGSVVDRHGIVIKMRLVKWFEAIGERRSRIAFEETL